MFDTETMTILGVVVALVGAAIAYQQTRESRSIDHLRELHTNEMFTETLVWLSDFSEKQNLDRDQLFKASQLLNHLELFAIGCERGIFSRTIADSLHKTSLISVWSKAQLLVFTVRRQTGNPRIYRKLEMLTRRLANA